jgi:D-alanine--poly(phosphoribitol) ligase subunit 1
MHEGLRWTTHSEDWRAFPRRPAGPRLTIRPVVQQCTLPIATDRDLDNNPVVSIHGHARTLPDAPALVLGNRVLSYQQLEDLAGSVAGWLDQASPSRTRSVAVLASRSLSAFAGITGALWSGRAYVPLSPKMSRDRLLHALTTVRPDAAIVDMAGLSLVDEAFLGICPRVLAPELPQGATSPCEGPAALRSASGAPTPKPLGANDLAYVMFTSGTTGMPKGVSITAGALRHFRCCVRDLYQLGPSDRCSQFSEVSFDFSVLDLFATWDAGASLHVVPEAEVLVPTRFIREHALTFWASVPSAILFADRVKMLASGSLPTLRASFFCGEALPTGAARAWRRAAPNSVIDNHYGPTEATVACSYLRFAEPPRTTKGRDVLAIGKAYPGMELAVVDTEGGFLPDLADGELALYGAQLASGYLGEADLTGRRFVTLKHARLGLSRWYLTGDAAYRDAEGCYYLLGRIDNQVKVLGHRIELEEIDFHLRAVSGCSSVATVAWPCEDGTALGLVAFLAKEGPADASLLASLGRRVPPYMVPQRILTLPTLPLSANGKIDRKALLERLQNAGFDRE